MIDRCSTYKLTNTVLESIEDDFKHEDYYKINKYYNGERDIKTPQQRVLDWIISILIK